MAITYDITTDVGKIRLLISDTSLTEAHFSDEELQVFLTMGGSVNLGAAIALESWAANLSESMSSESIGDYSYSKKSVSNKLELAKTLRENEGNAPVMSWAEMDLEDMDGDS
jgi:hypothetical protein